MNSPAWIEPAFAAEGFDIPSELRNILNKGAKDQPPLYFFRR